MNDVLRKVFVEDKKSSWLKWNFYNLNDSYYEWLYQWRLMAVNCLLAIILN
jgi:hypothetical protein